MPLVLVPTPLGNLRDITLRALDVLRAATLIVAEDTRVAQRLLRALEIPAPELWSYREQNAAGATPGILERARTELVALTTDAGMPGISDPGTALVAAARAAAIPVEVLPGANAALGAAVLSGFALRRFSFEGFPPRTARARRDAFARALESDATTLWYESPQRIVAALDDLDAVAPEARVFLVREYTKRFEQQLLGTPREVRDALERPVRGELSFAIAPCAQPAPPPDAPGDAEILALLGRGTRVAEIARRFAEAGRGERRALYARVSALRAGKGGAANAEET